MEKYWDINKILRFNRCFNFINGERSIGKSYTTQKFIVGRAIKRGQEFVYLVRTQDEKKHGILAQAFEKVLISEYKNYNIESNNDEMYLNIETETGKERKTLGYCIALSECVKIKKRSFPNVKYLMFDEYMLEKNQAITYVNGWKEPDLFLNIYHTIDREQDKVICFCLGNNTSFYNPYHLHKAFNIPNIHKGEIWKSNNVLFEWATSSKELKDEKNKCKFIEMLNGTDYGTYANDGNYIEDNINFIMQRSKNAYLLFTITYNSITYGVWCDNKIGIVFISDKYNPACKLNFALTLADHTENTFLTKANTSHLLKWLSKQFKLGNVRYENMIIKNRVESGINLLL